MKDKLEDLTTLTITIITITIIMILSGRIVLAIVTILVEVNHQIITTYHQIIISHKDKKDKECHQFLTIYEEMLITNPIIILTEIIIIDKEIRGDRKQGLI
jgi:hypothetical protein